MKDFKVIGKRYVRARRTHVCELCEREIGAGDLYYEECRKKDGIFRVKPHISCSKSGASDRSEFRKKRPMNLAVSSTLGRSGC